MNEDATTGVQAHVLVKTEAERYIERHFGNIAEMADHDRMAYTFEQGFGFAVLDAATVEALRRYGPFVEVGAGAGYWAWEFRSRGIDIVPTDISLDREGLPWGRVWVEANRMDAVSAAQSFPDRALLLVWPERGAAWVADVLRAYQGSTVVYVGEGIGGCTGSLRFHRMLGREWRLVETISIPTFPHIHDQCWVYRRAGAGEEVTEAHAGRDTVNASDARVCDDCLLVAYDNGIPTRAEQELVMIELGADVEDHLCETVESGGAVSCACGCRERHHV